MHSSKFTVIVAAIVAAANPAPLVAQSNAPEFAVAPIGAELAPGDVSFASAINEDGDATGEIWFNGYRQAFVHTYEHGPVLLPLIEGRPSARGYDVSDRDEQGEIVIVGVASDGFFDEIGHAAYWRYSTMTGDLLEVTEVGELAGFSQSVLSAVNNAGVAVGNSQTPGIEPMLLDVNTGVLSPLDFPVAPSDINNLGEVVGGTYRGTVDGGAVDLGIPPDTNGVTISAISDTGWIVGTVLMPYTDGAGHFVRGVARYSDGAGWVMLYANSWLDSANDINDHGDVVGALGISAAVRPSLYLSDSNQLFLLEDLIAPANPFTPGLATAVNNERQIAVGYLAAVLTPLGTMIIPGDVNGDATVDLDDLCAFLGTPIDLDGDGDVDADDETWLLARLAALGFTVRDCNENGAPDHCDIGSGASVDCNGNDVPDECEADCDGDGIPDECESDCNGNSIPDDCDLAVGTSEDCNGNGIPDECDVAVTIPYDNPFDPPVLLLDDSTYTDELLVTGAGTIADVDFTLDIDYRIGNLTVRLSHSGTTITLIDRPGGPQGNGQLGYRITLDDEGTGGAIQDQGNFGSPFEPIESPPSYTPMEALSSFDGPSLDGVWTVEVTTVGFSPVSSFISWGVVVTNEAVPVECAPGDLDADGRVDVADLLLLLAAWGPCPDGEAGCVGDVDEDGVVDVADLLELLANWG